MSGGQLEIGKIVTSGGNELDVSTMTLKKGSETLSFDTIISKPDDMNSSVTNTVLLDRLVTLAELSAKNPLKIDASRGTAAFYDKPNRSTTYTVYPHNQMTYYGQMSDWWQYPYSMFTSSFNTNARSTYYFESEETNGKPNIDDDNKLRDYSSQTIDATIITDSGYKYAADDIRFFVDPAYVDANPDNPPPPVDPGTGEDNWDRSPDINWKSVFNGGWSNWNLTQSFPTFEWQVRVQKSRDLEAYDYRSKRSINTDSLLSPLALHNNTFQSVKFYSRLASLQQTNALDNVNDYEYAGPDFSPIDGWGVGPSTPIFAQEYLQTEFGRTLMSYFKYDGLTKLGIIPETFKRVCNMAVSLPIVINAGDKKKLFELSDNALIDPTELDFRYQEYDLSGSHVSFFMSKSSDQAQTDRNQSISNFKDIQYTNTAEVVTEKNPTDDGWEGVNRLRTTHIFNQVDWARSIQTEAFNASDLSVFDDFAQGFSNFGIGVNDGSVEKLEEHLRSPAYNDETFYKGYMGKEYDEMTVPEKISHMFKVLLMDTEFGAHVEEKTGSRTWAAAGLWYALNYGRNAPTSTGFQTSEFFAPVDDQARSEFYEKTDVSLDTINGNITVGGKHFDHRIKTKYEDDNNEIQQTQEFNPHIIVSNAMTNSNTMLTSTAISWQNNEHIYVNTEYYSLKDTEQFGAKPSSSVILERLALISGDPGESDLTVIPSTNSSFAFRQQSKTAELKKSAQLKKAAQQKAKKPSKLDKLLSSRDVFKNIC